MYIQVFFFILHHLPVHDTLFLPLSCLDKGPREVFNEVTLSLHVEDIGFTSFLTFFLFMDPSKSGGVGICGFSGSGDWWMTSLYTLRLWKPS